MCLLRQDSFLKYSQKNKEEWQVQRLDVLGSGGPASSGHFPPGERLYSHTQAWCGHSQIYASHPGGTPVRAQVLSPAHRWWIAHATTEFRWTIRTPSNARISHPLLHWETRKQWLPRPDGTVCLVGISVYAYGDFSPPVASTECTHSCKYHLLPLQNAT